MSISFIKSDDAITVTLADGFQGTVYSSSPKFPLLRTAIADGNEGMVRELCNPKVAVEASAKRASVRGHKVVVKLGTVYFDGEAIHSSLAERIVDLVEEDLPVEPLFLFLENLMENPSYRAVEELYGFLEAGQMPVTEDGHFLAYKKIRSDWKDQYTGTIDNSIGEVVSMPRNKVNEDCNQTCSHGLHFCSRTYLGTYYSASKVVMVKINPRDVVAIPTDYQNSKGRCCRYEVVAEINAAETHIEGPLRKNATIIKDDVSGRSAEHMSSGAVACFDEDDVFVDVYENVLLAQSCTGVDASSIRKVCRGERKRAGGYYWRWAINVPDALETLGTEVITSQHSEMVNDPYRHGTDRPIGALGFGFDPEDGDEFDEEEDRTRWNDDIPF